MNTREVEDGEAADGRGDEQPPLPGHAGRVVGGAHGVRELADGGGELLLPPRVVAERDRVHARRGDLLRERHGDPAAGGGVLRVDDHGGHAELAADPGQLLLQDPTAGASHHVADHQHFHVRHLFIAVHILPYAPHRVNPGVDAETMPTA